MQLSAKYILTYLLLLTCFLSLTSVVEAFPSSSGTYKLEGEFGIFGGAKTSDNYRLTDTGGGFAPGIGISSNYRNCSGFQCVIAEVPKVIVTLSANTINLNTLTTSAVNTTSHTISVTTNVGGYTSRVYEDGNFCRIPLPCNATNDIADVTDGEVETGGADEEYGIATSESGQQITQDSTCGSGTHLASGLTTTPQSVANATGPTFTAESTTICYAATIAGSTAAGTYRQIVTFVTTGAF
mgnify:CR=1 FL=1